jgi:chromosome partitioning protein
MHTIALVSRKGGTGKSTLAVGLGVAALADGHKVCLLEADPLGTISNWRGRRTQAEPTVEIVSEGADLVRRIPFLANCGVSLTIIDTAGGGSDALAAAIEIADLCLIPARPSIADIEAAAPTLQAVRVAGKPFAFVLSQTQPRSARIATAASALSEAAAGLEMGDVLALPPIALRNDQQDALRAGLGVTEHAADGKSAEEIRALWQWVWAKLAAAPSAGSSAFGEADMPANEQAELRVAV